MIKGMTGYGNAQLINGSIKAIVEVKSLNHRYFDITYYLPIGFGSVENKIRQLVQKHVERGRVSVSVKITDKPEQNVTLNKEAVKKHLKYARVIKKEFGLINDLTLSDVIRLPGVIEAKESMVNPDKIWPILERSIKRSLTGLVAMRKREGRSLIQDVSDKLRRMSLQVKKIQQRAKVILRDKKTKLTLEEFQSFQKSSDVNEEITRLSHYIDEVRALLKSNIAVGKKIDFVAQEMQRETNTIGSKLQDKSVSTAVIALKSKIEKIREQSQNIE